MDEKDHDPKELENLKGLGELARQRCPRVAVELLYWIERMIDAAILQLERIAKSRSRIGYPDTMEIERSLIGLLALAVSGKSDVLSTLVTDIELLFTCVARIDNSLRKGLLESMSDPALNAIYAKHKEALKEKTDIRNHLEHMDERIAREVPPIYAYDLEGGGTAFEGVNFDIGHLRGQYYLMGGRWIDTSPEAFAFIDELRQDLKEWLLSLAPNPDLARQEEEKRAGRSLSSAILTMEAVQSKKAKRSKKKKGDDGPSDVV